MIEPQTIVLICLLIALGIVLSVPIQAIYSDDEKDLKGDKKD
jgi:hypothetical protein